MQPPKAFVSYSWDDSSHRDWVKALAVRLRADGVDVTLDKWKVAPGDQLTKFMETSIRENDFILIVCTPNYKRKSDNRQDGVGYEGDIMTGEVFNGKDPRKFIPIVRVGDWVSSLPSWLAGKYGLDFRGDPLREESYEDLLSTLHGTREQAPPVGARPTSEAIRRGGETTSRTLSAGAIAMLQAARSDRKIFEHTTDDGLMLLAGDQPFGDAANPLSDATNRDIIKELIAAGCAERDSESSLTVTRLGCEYAENSEASKDTATPVAPAQFEPIRIMGIIANEVGTPRNDGTQGSGLYPVPFQLSRRPSAQWANHFIQIWRYPPSYSTRHRPGIAQVISDRIVLDGTTVEEVADVHRDTLKVVVAKVNQDIEELERRQFRAANEAAEQLRQHRQAVTEAARRISFD
jgi:TIR domain